MRQFMQEGGQPNMAAANPTIDQLLPAIKSALEQGASLPEIIMGLTQQEVPMEIIAQAMQSIGVPEEEFAMAMQQLQGGAPQDQMAQQAPPMPPQGGPEGAPMDPAMEQAMMEQMASQGMPMAQEGAETGGNYEDSMLYIGDMGEDAPTYEPRETVITDYDKTYHYKQVVDPNTGETKYYSKDTRYKRPQWKDAGKPGDQNYDSISADVFGQNLENYPEGDPRRADFNKKLKKWDAEEKAKQLEAQHANADKKAKLQKQGKNANVPSLSDITGGGYGIQVINYAAGDEKMPPGHIEAILVDAKGNPVPYYKDDNGVIHEAFVNRWASNQNKGYYDPNQTYIGKDGKKKMKRVKTDAGTPNALQSHFMSKAKLDKEIAKNKYRRSMIINADSSTLNNFLTSVAKEDDRPYVFSDHATLNAGINLFTGGNLQKNTFNLNPDAEHNPGAYTDSDNCANGVCRAFDIDPNKVGKTIGLDIATDPQMVFATLQNNYKGNIRPGSVKGQALGREEQMHRLVDQAPEWLQPGLDVAVDVGADVYRAARDVKNWADENIDVSLEGVKNIPSWHYDTYGKDALNSINSFFGGSSNYWKQQGGSTGRYNDLVKAQYGYGKGLTTLTAGLPPESEEKPSSATEFMVDNMFGEGAYKSGKAALEDAQKWTEKHYQNFEPSKVLTDPVGAIDSVGKYWGLWQRGGGLDPQNIAKFSEFVDDYSRAQEGMDSVVGFALDDRLYDENNPAAVRSYMMESGAPDRSMTGYAKVPKRYADWKDYGSRNQDALRAEMEADPAWAAHPNSQPERPKPKPTVPKNVIDHMGYSRNIPGQSMYNTVNDLARFVRGYEDAKYDLEDSFGYNPPDVSNPAVVKQAMMQEPWRYGLTDYVDMDDQGNPIEGPMLSIPQGYSSFEEYANSPAMQKQIEERRRYGGSTKRRLKRAQLGYGGGYTLPINMVEDYQESKPGIIAADNMTPEQQAAYNNFLKLKQTYDAEVARVADVKQKIGDLARQHGDANAGWMDIASDWPRTGKWLEEPGNYACNSYSCRIMREAGVTVPEGVEPFKVSGNPYTYAPGDKIPIVTGNDTFNSIYEKLGFELMPKGTMPTKAGDLIRGHMYDPNASGSGAFHSVISAGYGDDELLDLYNNPGNVREGYRARGTDWDDPMRTGEGDFYTTDSGVMRYVGAVPYHEKQMMEAEAAYNALFEKQTGGTIPTLFEGSDEGFGSQGATADPVESQIQYYFSLPATMDGEPGPGGFGTIGEFKMAPKEQQIEWVTWASTQQNDQFTPGQMNPQNQQMMQLLEEVNSAKGGDKKYRTKSKQTESKKKGGSTDGAIELTTEQIAKIMAAGGSVKYL
jgi:hypothetical protein